MGRLPAPPVSIFQDVSHCATAIVVAVVQTAKRAYWRLRFNAPSLNACRPLSNISALLSPIINANYSSLFGHFSLCEKDATTSVETARVFVTFILTTEHCRKDKFLFCYMSI